MDIDVDPCDNFYDFACGSFIENNYTPDESVAVDTFTKLKETVDSKVNALLMDSLEKPSDMLNLSKSLFETCLERDRKLIKFCTRLIFVCVCRWIRSMVFIAMPNLLTFVIKRIHLITEAS